MYSRSTNHEPPSSSTVAQLIERTLHENYTLDPYEQRPSSWSIPYAQGTPARRVESQIFGNVHVLGVLCTAPGKRTRALGTLCFLVQFLLTSQRKDVSSFRTSFRTGHCGEACGEAQCKGKYLPKYSHHPSIA